MTPKYLQDEIDRQTGLRTGITANQNKWDVMPASVTQLDDSIKILKDEAAEMEIAEITLKKLKATIHDTIFEQTKIGDQVETLAKGIHAAEPEKLFDYGIATKKKDITPLPIPEKASITSINDDVTGEGFVLSILSLANATDFEIWRGTNNAPDVLSLEPDQFSYLSTTKRLSYLDDTILKGKRYFYRLRGFNRNGKGEWSAIVSRVQ